MKISINFFFLSLSCLAKTVAESLLVLGSYLDVNPVCVNRSQPLNVEDLVGRDPSNAP